MNPTAGDATRSEQVPVSAALADVEFPISPAPDAVEFWDGVERGELMLPWCRACEASFWYPRTACPRCGHRTIDWVPTPGRGTVHAFCITHQPLVAHLRDRVPYVTALVDLDEGVRMMGLLDVAPDPSAVHVGMGVAVEFVRTATRKIPSFRPRPEGRPTMTPQRFWHIGINTVDIERSIEFYRKVGFELEDRGVVENDALADAFMVPGGRKVEVAHLRINGDRRDEALIDLIQWVDPPTQGRAEPASMIDPGLCRFSILCDDLDERYETLSAAGVEFVKPPTTVMQADGKRGWKIVFATDPDGTLFHFVQQIGERDQHPT